MDRRNLTDERTNIMLVEELSTTRKALLDAEDALQRVRAWANTAKTWKGPGTPDPIGPLHGAGWIRAFNAAGKEVLDILGTEVQASRKQPPKEDGAGLGASPSAEGDRAFVLRTESPAASPPSGLQSLARDPHSLTEPEIAVLRASSALMRQFDALPRQHPSDAGEFASAIHVLQHLVAIRCARRLHPEEFPTYRQVKTPGREHHWVRSQEDPDGALVRAKDEARLLQEDLDFGPPGAVGRDPLTEGWTPK